MYWYDVLVVIMDSSYVSNLVTTYIYLAHAGVNLSFVQIVIGSFTKNSRGTPSLKYSINLFVNTFF